MSAQTSNAVEANLEQTEKRIVTILLAKVVRSPKTASISLRLNGISVQLDLDSAFDSAVQGEISV